MPDTILVVAEQREGKLNRVSFETLAAALLRVPIVVVSYDAVPGSARSGVATA